jgi:hypothetical protein
MDEFEDIKGVIWICKSIYRQHNGQKKKGKQLSKTKDPLMAPVVLL